jgi:hypothetical protein
MIQQLLINGVVSVRIDESQRIVKGIFVAIQRKWISNVECSFVRTHEPSQARRIEPRPKVIQPRLRVPFLTGQLVGIDDGCARYRNLAAKRVVQGRFFDAACGVGDDVCRAQVVGKVVMDGVAGGVTSRDALAVEENVLLRKGSGPGLALNGSQADRKPGQVR